MYRLQCTALREVSTNIACRLVGVPSGGKPEREVFGDLWRLDTRSWTWTELSTASDGGHVPVARSACGLVATEGMLLAFGGKAGTAVASVVYLADLWCFDLASSSWCGASADLLVVRPRLFLLLLLRGLS